MEQFLNELYLMMANDQFLQVGLSLVVLCFAVMFFVVGWLTWRSPWMYLEKNNLLDPMVAKIMYWLPAGIIVFALMVDRPMSFKFSVFETVFKFEISFALFWILCIIGICPIGVTGAIIHAHYRLIFKRDMQHLYGFLIPWWICIIGLAFCIYHSKYFLYYG